MQRCPALHCLPAASPTRTALQRLPSQAPQTTWTARSVVSSVVGSPSVGCPLVSHAQQAASCGACLGPWRLRQPRLTHPTANAAGLGPRSQQATDLGAGRDDGSGRSSSSRGSGGSDIVQLQPKPQAKYRRLTAAGAPGYAQSKPRRWHKATFPATASPEAVHVAVPAPPSASPAAAAGAPPQSKPKQHEHGQQQQRRRHQRGPQERSTGGGGQQRRHAPTDRRRDDDHNDEQTYDDVDEDEDEELLLGLSEEEVEAMVFASATTSSGGAGGGGTASGTAIDAAPPTVTAPGGGKRRRRGGGAGSNGGGAASTSSLTATDAIAAAGLPSELEPHVLAAVQSGSVSADGGILSEQLRQLWEIAADAAAITKVGGSGGSTADGAEVLRASIVATASILDCSPDAAVAVLVNYPRYVAMLTGPGDDGGGEGMERLRSFAGMLKLDLAETRDIVRRNPALLLAPYEPLRQKLTALANATGLSLAQSTAMVTPYMFPEL